MKTTRRRLTTGLLLLIAVSGTIIYVVATKKNPTNAEVPTFKRPDSSCRVVFINRDERVRRADAILQAAQASRLPNSLFIPEAGRADVWRKDPALGNNPIVFQDEMAVVRFRNRETAPLPLYVIRNLDLKPWGSPYSTQGGIGGSAEPRQVPRLTPEQALVVSVEVRDDRGHLMEPVRVRPSLISYFYWPPQVPSAADIRKLQLPEITLQPGEEVDVSFPLFGDVFQHDCWFRPGTYTIQVGLSWAEAPSGETKSMTAAPVTVCITPEHVKAAETYRDAFYDP